MSALPPKADIEGGVISVRSMQMEDIRETACASRRSLRNTMTCFLDQFVRAAVFRLLRHPSRPNAPRPVAKRGTAAGSGVTTGPSAFVAFELNSSVNALASASVKKDMSGSISAKPLPKSAGNSIPAFKNICTLYRSPEITVNCFETAKEVTLEFEESLTNKFPSV